MKKWLFILAPLLATTFAFAVVTPSSTDIADYCTGPNNSNCVYRIDSSGNSTGNNTTVQGTLAVTGASTLTSVVTHSSGTILTQQTVINLSTTTVIVPSASYLVLSSSGNSITMSGFGSNNSPVISTATATNGQFIILTSTSGGITGQVVLSSGAAAGLDLGAATRTLANGKTLGLIYNSFISEWVELFYGSN